MALDEKNRRYWVIDWLSRQGPAAWHGYSEKHDWDGSCAELHWIIRQPDCDRATAANIFWLSEPSYYLDGQHDQDPVANMDLEIIERWNAGFYKTSRFAFGGDYMDEHRADMMTEIGNGGHAIPPSLGEPIAGGEEFPAYRDLPVEIDINWYNAKGDEPPRFFLEKHGLAWDGSKIVGAGPAEPSHMIVERSGKLTGPQLSRIKQALADPELRLPGSDPRGLSEGDVSARVRRLRATSRKAGQTDEQSRVGLLGKLSRFWRE